MAILEILSESSLNASIETLIKSAQKELIFISPFIKLHKRIRDSLKPIKDFPEISITIVFGQNPDEKSKSFPKEDFDFISDFPNVKILYEHRLHAKLFLNESSVILTSMNLYDYSQNNNIEVGVLYEKEGILEDLKSKIPNWQTFYEQARNIAFDIIENSEQIFNKEPKIESKFLGRGKYLGSDTKIDKRNELFSSGVKDEANSIMFGFCIRTGKKIPFDLKNPFSEEAFSTWSKFSNKDYPEKFCHFSGELSNGETSFAKPILSKNWKKAKETFKL